MISHSSGIAQISLLNLARPSRRPPKERTCNQFKDSISSRSACCGKARKQLLPSQATEEDKEYRRRLPAQVLLRRWKLQGCRCYQSRVAASR